MAQTHSEIMLDKIRAVLEGRIDSDLEEYQIAGRQITKIPIEQLIAMETRYSNQVAAEKASQDIADGLRNNPNKILTRFVKP